MKICEIRGKQENGYTYPAANYSRIQNWYQIDAETRSSTLVKYINYLIVISININEN